MDAEERAHHKQSNVASSRPGYREARWERAVKVYTVNQESRYLLVQNVHALGVTQELLQLCSLYGAIEEYRLLDEYPSEPYTDVYWVKYIDINSARVAKKKLDNRSFFGKNIHVCYAPEFESVQDTREKLQQRRRTIASKTRGSYQKSQHELKNTRDTHPPPSLPHGHISHATPIVTGIELPSVSAESPQCVYPGDDNSMRRISPLLPHLPPPPPPPFLSTHTGGWSQAKYSSMQSNFSASGGSEHHSQMPHRGGHVTEKTPKNFAKKRHYESKSLTNSLQPSQVETDPTTSHSEDIGGLYSATGLTKSQRVAAFVATSSKPTPLKLNDKHQQSMNERRLSPKVQRRNASEHEVHSHGYVIHQERKSMSDLNQLQEQVSLGVHQQQVGDTAGPSAHKTTERPPPLVMGNRSLDSSVQTIRQQMNKVWQPPATETRPSKPAKQKKRKRI